MRPGEQNREERIADALSVYIDALGAGEAPELEHFLGEYPDLESELRPLLLAAFATQQAARSARVPPLADAKPSSANVTDFARAKVRREVERGTAVMPVNQRPDVLLLLLRATGAIWGKTRLQKLVVLVAKETDAPRIVPQFYKHYAYNFGPFDPVIHHDVTQLCGAGVLRVRSPKPSPRADRHVDAVYELTPNGEKFAAALARSADGQRVLRQLEELAAKYARMPLPELVRYVYTKYPEYTGNSKIRDEVLGKETDDDEQ